MAGVRYTAYEKKRAGGRLVWGVLRMEGRKQQFRSVGEGEDARRKAEELARKLTQLEIETAGDPDRFLSWHHSREPLPFDRAVRDYARTAQQTVAVSTATRYRQFAERLATRLGARDLARLQQEDVGKFVRAELTTRPTKCPFPSNRGVPRPRCEGPARPERSRSAPSRQ